MAGSQWRDRLLFGGLGLTMLLHALVLFGGRTAVPAVPVAGDMPRQGRKLQGLLDGLLGGGSGDGVAGTGLLDGLTVVSTGLHGFIVRCAVHLCTSGQVLCQLCWVVFIARLAVACSKCCCLLTYIPLCLIVELN